MSKKDGKADLSTEAISQLRANRARAHKARKEINRARYLRRYARVAERLR